jgi:hypothetical protein
MPAVTDDHRLARQGIGGEAGEKDRELCISALEVNSPSIVSFSMTS